MVTYQEGMALLLFGTPTLEQLIGLAQEFTSSIVHRGK